MKSENLSQKQKEPDGTNRPAEEHSNKAQPPIPPSSASGVSKVQPPPSPHSYAITCDKKRDVWDWIKFAAEIVGIGVVLVYTSIAALQWCEMKKTNKLTEQALATSKDQFRQDQRPYVWLAPGIPFGSVELVPSGIYAGHLGMPFVFQNYGKSPGIDVRVDAHIAVGIDAWRKVRWQDIPRKDGSIMPTNDRRQGFAYSDDQVDDVILRQVKSGHMPFIIFGHFEYTDMYNEPVKTYSSEFCTVSFGTPTPVPGGPAVEVENGICRYHNSVK
jgi:hypothetical protein